MRNLTGGGGYIRRHNIGPHTPLSSSNTQFIMEDDLVKKVLENMRDAFDREAREESEKQAKEESKKRVKEESKKRVKEESEKQVQEKFEKQLKEESKQRAKEESEKQARETLERQAREAHYQVIRMRCDAPEFLTAPASIVTRGTVKREARTPEGVRVGGAEEPWRYHIPQDRRLIFEIRRGCEQTL
jgi:hypothetical protein